METYIYNITILLIGLIFASATKCLVDSEEKRSFLTRRSRCLTCKKELSFLDVIFKFLIPYLLFSVTLYFT